MKRIKPFSLFLESFNLEENTLDEDSSSSIKTEIQKKISGLKSVPEVNEYLSELNDEYAPKSSKLVLIFPGYGQYSIVASLIYLSGINAQVFTSINDCIKVIDDLSSQGKKYEQIYVGSHGGGKEGLLHSIDEEHSSSVLDKLVNSISKIVVPGKTKIVFSACNGADYTGWYMKRIAELTNSFVYGSEGTYDWIANKSERGFWVCPPTPKTTTDKQGWPWTKEYNMCKKVYSSPFSWN